MILRKNDQFPGQFGREVSVLRAFGALAVVGLHVTGEFLLFNHPEQWATPHLVIATVLQFAVPLFLFLSGCMLALKYDGKFPVRPFYVRRLKTIVPLYLIMSVPYILVNDLLTEKASVGKMVLKVLAGATSYQMWFLPVILCLYLLYPLIIRLHGALESRRMGWMSPVLALAVALAWDWLTGLGEDLTVYRHYEFVLNRVFVPHLFPFVLGITVGCNLEPTRRRLRSLNILWPLLLVIPLIVVDYRLRAPFLKARILAHDLPFIPDPLASFFDTMLDITLFILLFKIATRIVRRGGWLYSLMRRLGNRSYGIYLIHVFFITGLESYSLALGMAQLPYLHFVVIFALVTMLSCVVVHYTGRWFPLSHAAGRTRSPRDGA